VAVGLIREKLAQAGYHGLSEQYAAIRQAVDNYLCTALGKHGRPTHLVPNP
jgi:hypothetical protein